MTETHAHPHGWWDAFAIWNLHARFLFRGGLAWRQAFSPLISWSHPDYPLLLPTAIAHFWTLLGRDDPSVPGAIGLIFTFSTVGLLFSAHSLLRGRTVALLGGITLLSTPSFVEVGGAQYADVPISFFILAGIALLCLHEHDSYRTRVGGWPGLLLLSGLAAGFAAWTKNEGLLFLYTLVVARWAVLVTSRTKNTPEAGGKAWMDIISLLVGMAPVLVLIGWFKHFIAPRGDLLRQFPNGSQLLDPARYLAILEWYATQLMRFGHWLIIPGTIALLVFWLLTRKNAPRPEKGIGFRTAILSLSLTSLGYFAVYLITPYDLRWHLHTSLNRLFLQQWPSVVFLFFLVVPGGVQKSAHGSVSK